MATRHVFALALGFAVVSSAYAQTPPIDQQDQGEELQPQVANGKSPVTGQIIASNVFVHSGPSNNYYPTMRIEKGAAVTVVGHKGEWLKIAPPPGSFSYVPSAYVTRRNDGKVGRVNSTLNVRAGSSLNEMKHILQVELQENQDVTILGEHQEYYKIVPPEGSYLYVHSQYVKPVRRVNEGQEGKPAGAEIARKPAAPTAPADPGTPAEPQPQQTAGIEPDDSPDIKVTETPSQPEAGAAQRNATDAAPAPEAAATKPTAVAVAEQFRALEAEFEAANKQGIVDQPIADLTERYTALAGTGGLTGANKRVVEARLKALAKRAEARKQFDEFRKAKDEMASKQRDLQQENDEITKRMTQVAFYTAVGTLRVSSIQQGSTTLYRLVDPTTGRTTVYLRSNDPKYAGLINQFVGVRGDLTSDARLRMKIIAPTEAEVVDAAKVNNTVIATITPPGMLLSGSTSATVDQAPAE